MFTLIGGGMKKLEDSFQPMQSVLPALAKWIQDSVVEFDPDHNCVRTKNGDTIEYEQMLVATGLQLKYEKIPGAVEALSVPGGNVCSNYSPDYVGRTLEALENFKGGNAIFSFPNSPVKCPGAPQKIVYIAEHYLRRVSLIGCYFSIFLMRSFTFHCRRRRGRLQRLFIIPPCPLFSESNTTRMRCGRS